VGGERQGMAAMFTMMNAARLGVGLQGLAVSVRAFQQALAYARERRQGRAPGAPAGEASPIVDHPDVRRMLVDLASSIDAMRLLLLTTAGATDVAEHHPDAAARARSAERVALLTPIAKAWCTDEGVRLASVAVQVHGGMGYVEETGVAQRYRDARIAPIYEGTNGIQAIDLVLRKVARDGGSAMAAELGRARDVLDAAAAAAGLGLDLAAARAGLDALERATDWVVASAAKGDAGRTDVLAGATAYLELAGVVLGGVRLVEQAAHAAAHRGAAVAATKAALARFFLVERVGPAAALADVVTAGGDRLDVPGLFAPA
jgi:butyryl-CoA dehydrogenase